ncbi:MAG: secreted protein [Candidatus Syntrophoarchaeum caldarius]|uniref:Secreted protein n=1 Tax=Candidatus Syntropharchaeum caldarium TaxID=1838285 RepID=A0A1F2P8S8_9EURY|nr:MAG: secreted protein [Candidatus Syntrophoarchaeum caldarius]
MVKIKLKKKGEEAGAAPAAPAGAASTTAVPSGVPPKITIKGAKVHIDEIILKK